MFEFGWTPNQWLDLSVEAKALVIAGIQQYDDEQAKAEKKAKAKSKHH